MNADTEFAEAFDEAHRRADVVLQYISRVRFAGLPTGRDSASAELLVLANTLHEARNVALNLDHALDHALDCALALDHPADPGLGRASDLTNFLVGTFDRAGVIASDLAAALTSGIDLAPDCGLARDLAQTLDRALSLADQATDLITHAHGSTKVGAPEAVERPLERQVVRIAALAERMAAVAARSLPAADRARYGEEFRGELWDLAAAGAGRRQQIGYALRQFRFAVPLRFAVLSPRHKKAAP